MLHISKCISVTTHLFSDPCFKSIHASNVSFKIGFLYKDFRKTEEVVEGLKFQCYIES